MADFASAYLCLKIVLCYFMFVRSYRTLRYALMLVCRVMRHYTLQEKSYV